MSCPFKAGDLVKDVRDGEISRVKSVPGDVEYDLCRYSSPNDGVQLESRSGEYIYIEWKFHSNLSLWRPNE